MIACLTQRPIPSVIRQTGKKTLDAQEAENLEGDKYADN